MLEGRAELIEKLFRADTHDLQIVRGIFDLARHETHLPTARRVRELAGIRARDHARDEKGKPFLELYWEIMLWSAQNGDLDSFLIYIEKNRPRENRFYQNRRAVMKPIVDALQAMYDDELDELFISMPPRVGKTALVNFFTAFLVGMEPESTNLYCSCNAGVSETYYKGVLEIINDDATYTFREIFPKVEVAATNSKEHTLDMGRAKKYPTLRCVSIDQDINGKADCNRFLIGDDLCSGIEEAMSPDRLEKLWSKTQNNLIPRQVGKRGKIVWIGTRWSLFDPIGRQRDILENEPKYTSRRWKAIDLPALNEHDESNFDYPNGAGMNTEQYHQRRAVFERGGDMASWLAQYMAEPIERNGQLFDPSMMRFYNGELPPDRQPDRIFAYIDVAFGGGDYLAMCIAKQYDNDIYIDDAIFNDGDKFVTVPLVCRKIIEHNVAAVRLEGTTTTASYKEAVEKALSDAGYRCNITMGAASTRKSKDERIFDRAPEIREFWFRDTGCRTFEYAAFMRNLHAFVFLGKNKHDDAPDSLAGLCGMIHRANRAAVVFQRPF